MSRPVLPLELHPSGTFCLLALAYMLRKIEIWRRLLRHCVLLADSRALLSVGSRIEISTAMMPITTSNSTSVKARRSPARERRFGRTISFLLRIELRVGIIIRPDLLRDVVPAAGR